MKKLLLTVLIIFVFTNISQSQNIKYGNSVKPNTIILKINKEYKSICNQKSIDNNKLNKFFASINTSKIEKKYPRHQSPKSKYNKYGNKLVDLSLIYEIEYKNGNPKKIFNYLNSLNIIEYAQPHYIPQLLYTPNDPNISAQYYLNNIQAYNAWDISKGDSNIVVGITDTGMDFSNEDLVDNLYYNTNDPPNLIDDDNDGFIDNYKGWDIGENDANPQWNENNISGKNPHGIATSGTACAKTDNNYGMAGPGFWTKFLPIKISNEEGLLLNAYDGIVYAADHGCSIINCSWGGSFGHYYGQDIVNYATFNKNSLVVAAAGNSHLNIDFYPASYKNVLSIAGTNSLDYKWTPAFDGSTGGSNYGYHIDVAAPAVGIYTTYVDSNDDPGWVTGFGTSYSAPIVSGCAGIIKAHYDTLSALQIGEVLRVTADNIDTIPFNVPYAGLLGSGRVNLYRALSDTLPPSIRFNNIRYNNEIDSDFQENDTIYITGKYTNYLSKSTNCTAIITTTSTNVQIIQNSNNIGSLATMDTINNNPNPFIIKLLAGIDYDKKIVVKITYTDTNYSAYEYFDFKVNSSIVNIDTNNIATSLTSVGKIGYENYYPINGIGFIYKNTYEMLYEAGLMLASGSNKVSDCIRGNNDFLVINKVKQTIPATVSHFDVNTIFNDNNATTPIGVEISQNTFAWNNSLAKDFIIVKYDIINNSSTTLDSLYVGLFADWDIIDYSKNIINFNQSNNISYTNSGDGSDLFAGIQLLSGGQINHYAIDNVVGGEGGIDISDGFSESEKLTALSTNRHNAGQNGNDVCDVLGNGPFTLTAGDTINVAFALHSNIHLNNLLNSAIVAQAIYDSLYAVGISKPKINKSVKIYPNPTKGTFTIEANNVSNLQIIDIFGRIILEIPVSADITNIDLHKFPKGLYIVKIAFPKKTIFRKIILE